MADLMITEDFTHILRVMNTNIDGKTKVLYAITKITGVGRRFAQIVCRKAEVDVTKRAGELSQDEVERLITVIQNPQQFKIKEYLLNRRKDFKTGKSYQVVSNNMPAAMRDDLERLKKARVHRGLRHYWGLRVRGQHTKTTGRNARAITGARGH